MKSYKKLLALAIVLVMMLALTAPAMATGADDPSTGGEGGSTTPVNITIKRDSSYDKNATGDRVYTWYKVFTAIPADTLSGTGGGHNDAGAPGEISYGTTPPAVAYKASSTIAAKLGSWNAETKTWTRKTGNNWFDLIPIAGQTNYTVKWAAEATDSAAAQAAAVWLLANGVYESSGNLTWNATDKTWTASASGWVVTLKPTDAVKGKTITITFQATVADDAVGKELNAHRLPCRREHNALHVPGETGVVHAIRTRPDSAYLVHRQHLAVLAALAEHDLAAVRQRT